VFDHVGIAVSDIAASERFYRTVLSVLGAEPSHADAELVESLLFAIYSPVTQQASGLPETSVDFHGLTGKVFETAWRLRKRAPSGNPLR
jgi:catechol 2,3-dioxygenase-like lactoylglutathione lyase family enzyme